MSMGIGDENIPDWYKPYPITHPDDHLPKETESFMPDNNSCRNAREDLARIEKDIWRIKMAIAWGGSVLFAIVLVTFLLHFIN